MSNATELSFDELNIGRELMTITDELTEQRSEDGLTAVARICGELIKNGVIDGNLECNYSFVSISDYASFAAGAIRRHESTVSIKSNWQRPDPNNFKAKDAK